MDQNIQDLLVIILFQVETAKFNLLLKIFIKDNGLMVNFMDLEHIYGKLDKYIRANI